MHILIPNLDLNDPGIDAAVAQGWIPGAPGKGRPGAQHEPRMQRPSVQPQPGVENKSDTNIEAMMKAVAQLDMDESGNWDYHGHSSGLSFVRRMREQLGEIMGPETISTPFLKNRPLSHVLDSPKSIAPSAMDSPGASEPLLQRGTVIPARESYHQRDRSDNARCRYRKYRTCSTLLL